MRFLPVLLLLSVAGCQLEAQVKVAFDGPDPKFVVTYDRGKVACVQGLTVTDLTGGTRRDVWAIRRIDVRDKARCVGTVVFGITPPGYETAVSGARLSPGRRYEVSTSGAGWQAQSPFSLR